MTKNEMKYYSSLLKKKYRDEEKKFLAEGKKIVAEGLKSNYECELIAAAESFIEEHDDLPKYLRTNNLRVDVISDNDFKKLSDTVTPQGIAAVFRMPTAYNSPEENLQTNLIMVLEHISDPGNVGTIIRNCDWFGITELVLTKDCADPYNPKSVRASMGSIFHLNIFANIDLLFTIPVLKLKNYKILCADLNGKNIFKYYPSEKSLIVLSNEANGPSAELLKIADEIITIPKIGHAESLNVASASAVILSHLTSGNH